LLFSCPVYHAPGNCCLHPFPTRWMARRKVPRLSRRHLIGILELAQVGKHHHPNLQAPLFPCISEFSRKHAEFSVRAQGDRSSIELYLRNVCVFCKLVYELTRPA
ncbi:unnamed protein product, partial [Ectocarpus sp. 12 AP-2014]